MKLGSREILEILETVRELGFRQFRLVDGDVALEVSTQEGGSLAMRTETSVSAPTAVAQPPTAPAAVPQAAQPEPSSRQISRPGLVAVVAPMAGTFYRSPSPGAPHFVEVGTKVTNNDVVCIVEVMKLFNSLRAGCSGVIAEIAATNEAMVTPGQPIMWIRPE